MSSQSRRFVCSCRVVCTNRARFNPIWEFGYTINGTPCDMVFTSVAGHLMELDFTQQHKRWRSCSPLELYNAPVVKAVPDVSQRSRATSVLMMSASDKQLRWHLQILCHTTHTPRHESVRCTLLFLPHNPHVCHPSGQE